MSLPELKAIELHIRPDVELRGIELQISAANARDLSRSFTGDGTPDTTVFVEE